MLSFQLNEIITPIALGLHVSDTIFIHTTVKTYKMGPDFLHFLFFNRIILLEYSRFHELEHYTSSFLPPFFWNLDLL